MEEEIDRYHYKYCELSGASSVELSNSGEYVLYDDYIKLVAENNRLLWELAHKDASSD